MKLPKFKLEKDWIIKSEFFENDIKKIFKEGHIFEANEKGEYIISSPLGTRKLSLEQMRENNRFKEVKRHQMNVEKINNSTDEKVNNWRIQLDVKTTKSKLKEVQRLIEKHVYPIL